MSDECKKLVSNYAIDIFGSKIINCDLFQAATLRAEYESQIAVERSRTDEKINGLRTHLDDRVDSLATKMDSNFSEVLAILKTGKMGKTKTSKKRKLVQEEESSPDEERTTEEPRPVFRMYSSPPKKRRGGVEATPQSYYPHSASSVPKSVNKFYFNR